MMMIGFAEDLKLTPEVSALIRGLSAKQMDTLEEMRFRRGLPAEFVFAGEPLDMPLTLDGPQMDALVTMLCGCARYAFEAQMAQGYIPLPGGHRAGVCGKLIHTEDGRKRLCDVTSVCIRISRDIPGASLPVRAYIKNCKRLLILGPPGCGKTTVLRDAARWLSDECGLHVAVADEREELFAGIKPGRKMDVIAGAGKAEAVQMLLRAMGPQVIVTDEVGDEADVKALQDAARCGIRLLASAHADGWQDVERRPVLKALLDAGTFDGYVFLGRHGCLKRAYDAHGRPLDEEAEHGKCDCGDGDCERDRVSCCGRRGTACAMDSGDAPLPCPVLQCHSI